jgi:hypothetical protein
MALSPDHPCGEPAIEMRFPPAVHGEYIPSVKIHQRQKASLPLGQRLARSTSLRDQFLPHHGDAGHNIQNTSPAWGRVTEGRSAPVA